MGHRNDRIPETRQRTSHIEFVRMPEISRKQVRRVRSKFHYIHGLVADFPETSRSRVADFCIGGGGGFADVCVIELSPYRGQHTLAFANGAAATEEADDKHDGADDDDNPGVNVQT